MKRVGIIGTAAVFLLFGTTAPGWAQHEKQNEDQGNSDKDKQDKGKGHAKAGKEQKKEEPEQKAAPHAKRQHQQEEAQQGAELKQRQAHENQRARQHQQAVEQQQVNEQRQANQQQQVEERKQANRQRQEQHQQQVQERQDANQQRHAQRRQGRLSQERQQQLITEQQRHVVAYRQHLDEQQVLAQQYGVRLQEQNRMANYRFQQDYLERMRRQQSAFQVSYDYDSDPYFYTAPNYRYSRGGSYYEINEYGANMLRRAIRNGYAEGYRAGQADRQDRWRSDYQSSYAYQDANYGFNGYYGNQAEYNYYFREGFNRGYKDGYYRRTQYGQYSSGARVVLGGVVVQILGLQSIR